MTTGGSSVHIKELLIVSERRLELTKEYCRIHYGYEDYRLFNPKMIVVHYTAFATFEESYHFVSPDELSLVRDDISSGGTLNVGTHFLVDCNGDIYRLIPDDIIVRHTIGFNHVALSIENVGLDENHLTGNQIEANALLIDHLVKKHSSIEYLIGHYEYMDRDLPHFLMHKENLVSYPPTKKIDPGVAFMSGLRKKMADQYQLVLKK